jgi:hypothetical protein
LVLWDVDHTLIENGGVSKETYAGAYELLTGQAAIHRARTDGRTDPAVMSGLFEQHETDQQVAAYAAGYDRKITYEREVNKVVPEGCSPL